MILLSVDLGGALGWCRGRLHEKPSSGVYKLAEIDDDIGDIGWKYMCWLEEQIASWQISHISWEKPWINKIPDYNRTSRLFGLDCLTHTIARRHGISRHPFSTAEVTKFITGSARHAKGKKKEAVMAAVWKLGFKPRTDDEADAIAVWVFAENIVDKGTRRVMGPLFDKSHHPLATTC